MRDDGSESTIIHIRPPPVKMARHRRKMPPSLGIVGEQVQEHTNRRICVLNVEQCNYYVNLMGLSYGGDLTD